MTSANGNLNDLIGAKQLQLERANDKIASYDDPNWIRERKQKLVDKRDEVEQELNILVAAQDQLSLRRDVDGGRGY